MTTLLLADHTNARLADVTAKALSAATALGAPVHILVAGHNCAAAAADAVKLAGVEKVLVADGALYANQMAEPLA
ncbi:MAG: electron transfer flavoprotein subunit alpha/FixB family protein, partial [Beijerinckiaceae bacterium]